MTEIDFKNSKWELVGKYVQYTFIWEKTIIFKNTFKKNREEFLELINMFLKKKKWDCKMKLTDEWIINGYTDYIFIYKSPIYAFNRVK